MLNKPINPEPYNTYITKDESEIIGCDIPGNKKIIGDYTKVVDIETSETVYEVYSQYEDSPKSRVEYENVLANAKSGKEYSWNTFYWEKPKSELRTYSTGSIVQTGDNKITLVDNIDKSRYEFTGICTPNSSGMWNYGSCTTVATAGNALGDLSLVGKYAVNFDDSPLRGYYKGSLWTSTGSEDCQLGDITNYLLVAVKASKRSDGRFLDPDLDAAGNYQVISLTEIIDFKQHLYNDTCVWIYFDDIEFYDTVRNYDGLCMYCFCSKSDSSDNVSSSMISYDTSDNKYYYYYLRDVVFMGGKMKCEIYPCAQSSIDAGNSINMYSSNEHWNISPNYYFRCKTNPTITINSTLSTIDHENMLHDMQSNFSVKFEPGDNCAAMNYYQLYLYAQSPNGKYVLIEKSNKLFSSDASHLFRGFINGNSYKVVAICIDNDGDEWTKEITFAIQYSNDYANSKIEFDRENYAVRVSINKNDIDLDVTRAEYSVYKHRTGYLCADYVGDFSKTDSELVDYNIQNDMDYTYYIRKSYMVSQDVYSVIVKSLGKITPDFLGSCIMGLENSNDGEYRISKVFYLNYHFNDLMHESTQELSRDYVGTFGKYQQELRGATNYISDVAEGLLGYEAGGGYTEANNIKNDWLNFINDNSIKLYKGFDGNTMLISITASKIKPRYYAEYGLVNEVNISFKQIGDMENSTIYETEV